MTFQSGSSATKSRTSEAAQLVKSNYPQLQKTLGTSGGSSGASNDQIQKVAQQLGIPNDQAQEVVEIYNVVSHLSSQSSSSTSSMGSS
jgi:hypothetical protein